MQIYRILFEEYGAQHWWPADTHDEVIIGAILTQNTNWKNVKKAISNLKKKQLLSLSALSAADIAMITDCIRPAGHYNQKAERLKLVSNALKEYIVPPVSNE
ncbi:MAG: endonuclease, partial [Candidatus Cloacimonetes bacterium]|nr:endonuclease [Candidatus Cloacimonadota bacterium]